MSDPLNHVGSVWYHLESSDVRYILQTNFLVWTFFAASYCKRALTENVCKCGSTRGHNHKSRANSTNVYKGC